MNIVTTAAIRLLNEIPIAYKIGLRTILLDKYGKPRKSNDPLEIKQFFYFYTCLTHLFQGRIVDSERKTAICAGDFFYIFIKITIL